MAKAELDLTRCQKLVGFARLAKESELRKAKLNDVRPRCDYLWRLLLELYLARAGQYRLLATSLWAEAGVTQATGGRWLDYLVREGLASKVPTSEHPRAVYVELTSKSVRLIEDHLICVFGLAEKLREEM